MSDYVTCTPHRPNCRFFMIFEDFVEILDHDVICAAALRVIEAMTNNRITYLRNRYHIPSNLLPDADDLWVEVSLRDLEWWSIEVRRKSAYARALLPRHEKHPSLIQRGHVRSRYIARREDVRLQIGDDGKPTKPSKPARKVCRDDIGSYIIVDDQAGGYEEGGRWYSAAESGYTKIVRQFLYCIEAVRAAIADLDNDPPPKPYKRWHSIAGGESHEETSQATTCCNCDAAPSHAKNELQRDAARRGTSSTVKDVSFAYHDNTISGEKSMKNASQIRTESERTATSERGHPRPKMDGTVHRCSTASEDGCNKNQKESKNSKNSKKDSAHASRFSPLSLILSDSDYEDLRWAKWCPETLLALLSRVLPVPNFDEIEESGDAAAIEQFYEDWLRPTERLMQRLDAHGPQLAFERIDYQTRYMTQAGSPSWWQRRARNSPITMRHVADNHESQWNDLRKQQWRPRETTPYDGPPDAWLSSPPQPQPDTAPLPPERGMPRIIADQLAGRIMLDHPGIIVSNVEIAPGRFAIGIAYADEQWFDFETEADYDEPSQDAARLIELATDYGRQRAVMRA